MAQQVKVYSKKITPDEAVRFLKNNSTNRKLYQKNVNFYHGQMAAGQWLLTGDAIQFNTKGRLLNGQHRLHAVIKYGKPVEFLIAENVPDEAFKVMDTGKTRSAGDALQIMGYKNCHNIAGTCRSILLFKAGKFDTVSGRAKGTSNTDIVDFAEAHKKEIVEIVDHINTIYRNFRFMNPTVLAALYYIFSKKSQEECDAFFEKYGSGANLSETSPVRLLREKLMHDVMNKTKMNLRDRIAIHILAWNAFRKKERNPSLKLMRNYEFPKVL